jgi:energy-coupling factor transport system permease protein
MTHVFSYAHADSPLHRLDPRLKLPACLLFQAGASAGSGVVLALGGALCLAGYWIAQRPWTATLYRMRYFLLFLIGAAALQGVSGGVSGWVSGLLYTARIAVLVFWADLLTGTTRITDLIHGFDRIIATVSMRNGKRGRTARAGVRKIGLGVSLSLGFIPVLFREMDETRTAIRLRSAGSRRRSVPSVASGIGFGVSLVSRALLRAETTAEAVRARGWSDHHNLNSGATAQNLELSNRIPPGHWLFPALGVLYFFLSLMLRPHL